jgi:Papain fold toxin 1, glutamine deamidase
MTSLPRPVPHPLDHFPVEVPPWAYDALEWVIGFDWPEGDESATWDVADRWYALASALSAPHDAAFAAASRIISGYVSDGLPAEGFLDAWQRLAGDDEAPLNALLQITHEVGGLVEESARQLEAAKLEAWIELGLFLTDLTGLALTNALVRGAASPAAGARIADAGHTVRQIFQRLLELFEKATPIAPSGTPESRPDPGDATRRLVPDPARPPGGRAISLAGLPPAVRKEAPEPAGGGSPAPADSPRVGAARRDEPLAAGRAELPPPPARKEAPTSGPEVRRRLMVNKVAPAATSPKQPADPTDTSPPHARAPLPARAPLSAPTPPSDSAPSPDQAPPSSPTPFPAAAPSLAGTPLPAAAPSPAGTPLPAAAPSPAGTPLPAAAPLPAPPRPPRPAPTPSADQASSSSPAPSAPRAFSPSPTSAPGQDSSLRRTPSSVPGPAPTPTASSVGGGRETSGEVTRRISPAQLERFADARQRFDLDRREEFLRYLAAVAEETRAKIAGLDRRPRPTADGGSPSSFGPSGTGPDSGAAARAALVALLADVEAQAEQVRSAPPPVAVDPPGWARTAVDPEPAGAYGGLRPPSATDQAALLAAVPRDGEGNPQRWPDPRSGRWFALINADGPGTSQTRALNCLDAVLALYETYVHGRPRVAAARSFDGYSYGDPDRSTGGEWAGLDRIQRAAGTELQNLCPYVGAADPVLARPAVDAALRNLTNHLHNTGHGAFAVIVTDLEGGGCHTWAAVNQNDVVLFLDPQVGRIAEETALYRHHGVPSAANVVSMDALVVDGLAEPAPLPFHGPGQWSGR